MTFAEKCVQVWTAQGYTAADIEEAKQVIRNAWADSELKQLWINWINEQAKVWR